MIILFSKMLQYYESSKDAVISRGVVWHNCTLEITSVCIKKPKQRWFDCNSDPIQHRHHITELIILFNFFTSSRHLLSHFIILSLLYNFYPKYILRYNIYNPNNLKYEKRKITESKKLGWRRKRRASQYQHSRFYFWTKQKLHPSYVNFVFKY